MLSESACGAGFEIRRLKKIGHISDEARTLLNFLIDHGDVDRRDGQIVFSAPVDEGVPTRLELFEAENGDIEDDRADLEPSEAEDVL